MADILLIHGAAHGAWCWRHVIPALVAGGHQARAIDLPGHGDDPTPYAAVTLDAYRDAVLAAMGPSSAKRTVLVGHSMGGYPITAAAVAEPDRVAGLIYVCAYAPWPDHSLAQMRMRAPRQPLLPAIRMTEDRLGWTADPAMVPDLFYHDCPPDDVTDAMARLCVQAVAPTSVPVAGLDRAAHVPRAYVRCTDDRTIPPEFQVTMTEGWPAARVVDMACSHSPFYAAPDALAGHIDHFIKGF